MSQPTNPTGEMSPSAPADPSYPPQLHAGAVDLGPEFGKGAPISEKIDGLKQEIKGKIKHDPELVERGRQQRTGELKSKEMREDPAPFGQPGQSKPDEEKPRQE